MPDCGGRSRTQWWCGVFPGSLSPLQARSGTKMVSCQMERNSKQRLGDRDGARVGQSGGNKRATPREAQRGFELPHAFMEDVHPSQQLQLIGDIITLFGNCEASVQSHARQFAVAKREHQRKTQSCLNMHFLSAATRSPVKPEDRSLRPTVTFGKQRHRQKDWRSRGDQAYTNLGVAVHAKAPLECSAYIVKAGKMRGPLGGVRHVGHSAPVCSSHRR